MPVDRMIGGILFLSCLSVCLLVVNFNIRCKFLTIRDKDFIFGFHTALMIPIQIAPTSMTLTLTFMLKIAFLTFLLLGA